MTYNVFSGTLNPTQSISLYCYKVITSEAVAVTDNIETDAHLTASSRTIWVSQHQKG